MTNKLREIIRNSRLYCHLENPIYKLKGSLFDLRYGVTTAPEVRMGDLNIDSPNASLGVKYAGTEPKYFKAVLNEWAPDFTSLTFIDFGSGMGRALLMASEKPFKKVIGVEFSHELAEISKKNLANFSPARRKCGEIEVLCQDATAYDPPPVPSVFYFFNPFDRKIFVQVIRKLEESLAAHPRTAYVLYANPEHNDLFETSESFEQIETGRWHTLHRSIESGMRINPTPTKCA